MENLNKKVYCDHCAYLSNNDYDQSCENKNNWTLENNWNRRYKNYKELPSTKNKNNNCPDFKLVWYRRLFGCV